MSQARSRKDLGFYLVMIAPAVLLMAGVIALPILLSVAYGFTDYGIKPDAVVHFIGLDHYLRIFQDPVFWQAFWNNMFVVAVSVFLQIPVAFVIAFVLYRSMVKGSGFFQSMVFLPNFLSTIVVGMLFHQIFNQNGPASQLVQWITGDLSAQANLFARPETAMIPIGIALIWMYAGFYMITFLANMQKIDAGIIEAARIDGASEAQIFLKIVAPILSGTLFLNCILAIAGSLKGFDLIYAMTGGGPGNNTIVLPIYMYNYAFRMNADDSYSYGSAISNVIVALSIGLILISNWVSKKTGSGEAS